MPLPKIATLKDWLSNLHRTTPDPEDNRIFPMWYAPVIVMRDGKRTITPMRYHCRRARDKVTVDHLYPGLYNARRDNLQKFWREQFGHSHAIMAATSFFENVEKHAAEHRDLAPGEKPENIVLQFQPNPPSVMYLGCLWSRWEGGDKPALHSFAAITDEPPPEVKAAGHDRCVIPIAEKNIDAWLTPEGRSAEELFAILDERERPYYEHRLAA